MEQLVDLNNVSNHSNSTTRVAQVAHATTKQRKQVNASRSIGLYDLLEREILSLVMDEVMLARWARLFYKRQADNLKE